MAQPATHAAIELPLDWEARLRRALLSAPDHRPECMSLGGLITDPRLLRERLLEMQPAGLKSAAVLIPIIVGPAAPALLMTVRASHLRRHPGQISFPGGRLEASDVDVAAAAIRETEEEIGIASRFIEPIGFLPDLCVLTGYRITPVVALLRSGFTITAQDTEVAEVFELPLQIALASDSYRVRRRMVREQEFDTWELPFGQYQIWGATAGMLAMLRDAFAAVP